jgi:hypothetical protein
LFVASVVIALSGTDAVMGEKIEIKMKEYEIGVDYGWKF